MGRLTLLGVGAKGASGGGGGLTTTPSYIATGSPVTLSTAQNPAYGTNAAGDLFIMHVYGRGVISAAPTAPSGWSVVKDNPLTNQGLWVYSRDARSTGSESGTVTIPTISVGGGIAVIHTFRNVATSSFIEDITGSSATGNSTTIPAPTVAAAGICRLAVGVVGRGDDIGTRISWTGETGGDWTEQYDFSTSTGSDSAVQLQVAPLASGGTITGGDQTDGLTELYATVGFALVGV